MISVIMPIFNAEKFLKRSIDSILSQTEKDFELIIVNDGSTDASEDIILSYSDHRVIYVRQKNQGVAAARNKGLDIARGEFIAWQDADDVSIPIRLEIMKNSFTSDTIGFVHCDMLLIDEKGVAGGYWQYRNIDRSRLLRFFLKKGMPCHVGGMMMKKDALGDSRFDTTLKTGSDSDLFFRIGLNSASVHIPKPLYVHSLRINNTDQHYGKSEKTAHVRKFLTRHSLEELVPELDWKSNDEEDNQARACAIISLLLARRGMQEDADEWIEKAKNNMAGLTGRLFVRAISLLQENKYDLARETLQLCPIQDCIVINYLGEIAAFSDDASDAYDLFMKSSEMNPYYVEPVDNLRGLGGKNSFRLVDTSWLRLRQVS